MPSDFAARWAKAAPAIDDKFGDSFRYEPLTDNPAGGRKIADTSRPVKIITGALSEFPAFAFPETSKGRGSVVLQEANQDSEIDIAADALPYEARTGDQLTQVTVDASGNVTATGAVFKVNGPQPDGIARIMLRVIKVKSGIAT